MSRPLVLVGTVAVASAAAVALLWTEAVPLGVPGEWTWGRLNYSAASLVWAAMVCGVAAAIFVLMAYLGDHRLAPASGERQPADPALQFSTASAPLPNASTVALWLSLLVLGAFAWLTAVQSVAIEGVGLAKAPYVLYYRRTEGYFWQARYDLRSVSEFLAGYEDLLAERDYLHIGTHPPGLALAHCGLLELCRRSPRLVSLVRWTEPPVVAETLARMQSLARGTGHEITPVDAAALWLATLLTQFAAALTVVPLYLYVRLSAAPSAAWRAAVFWPLVPAIAVFLPKSDVLYPLLAMTAAWLWRLGCLRAQDRIGCVSLLAWLLGSLVLWTGMLLSLAFLTVGALLAVQMVCDMVAEGWSRSGAVAPKLDPASPRPGFAGGAPVEQFQSGWWLHHATVIVCSAGCGLLTLGLVLTLFGSFGLNLLSVWQWNLANHALFYEHNVRTSWKWLLVNPLELTLAAGVPVVALAMWGALRQRRNWRALFSSPVVPFTVVWVLLWLSGKNMGEAARLWIILLPWLVAATVNAWRPMTGATDAETPAPAAPSRRLWLTLLIAQIAVAAATTLRVDGFHFTELLRQ